MKFIYNNNVSAVVIVYILCLYPKRYSKLQILIMYGIVYIICTTNCKKFKKTC